MKLITYITSTKELDKILANDVCRDSLEFIVGCLEISRYINTTFDEMLKIINLAKKNGLTISLEWDVLSQENRFLKVVETIKKIPLHDLSAIRLQDPGAVNFVKSNYPWLVIHLILENGNHNLVGLKKWCHFLGEQCQRIVLSNELSKDHLLEYCSELKVQIEVLVLGRILLFYSPRLLLSPLEKTQIEGSYLEARGSSEESPHSGFPILENSHGTFMFNVKDLYLLDHVSELEQMGIEYGRADLRFDNLFEHHFFDVHKFFRSQLQESQLKLKQSPERPFIKGFYNINKTDVLFTKLKNRLTQRRDHNYIGEVVDVERDRQLTILVKHKDIIHLKNAEIKLITPEGKEKITKLNWIKDSNFLEVEKVSNNDIILIPIVNGITVKTQVYLNSKT